jgi:hypothetical protein
MKRSMKNAVLGTVLSASLCLAAMGPANACEKNGKWMSGDFHQHTFYTDGSRWRAFFANGCRYISST